MNSKSDPSFLSRLFFWWTVPKLLLGRKRELQQEDVAFLLPEDNTETLLENVQGFWNEELAKKRPSLRRALLKAYGPTIVSTSLAVLFQQCVLRVSTPILIGFLIRYAQGRISHNMGITVGALFILSNFLSAIIQQLSWFRLDHLGMKTRVSVTALVYQKVFRLSQEALATTGVGQLTNIISNDVNRFERLKDIPYVVAVPLQILTISVVFWLYMGISGLTGIAILLILLPLQAFGSPLVFCNILCYCRAGLLGRGVGKWRAAVAQMTDRRIRLLSEVLGGIMVIKMSTWESIFSELVQNARKNELKCILRKNRLMGINFSLFNVGAKCSIFFTLLTLYLLGHKLSAEIVFVTLSMYNIVTSTASIYLPQGMAALSEILVSISRIQKILLLGEKIKTDVSETKYEASPFLRVRNLCASWSMGGRLVLDNISMSVGKDELVGIVGPIGSGKTSLIEGILGELTKVSGSVELQGKIAYVPQEPWTFQGTIRENIVFGLPFDREWYFQVIEAAAMNKDLEAFPLQDSTLIGDNGISLSGGQRARISLARAIYANADIYLLDDPLSAVDVKVGQHLMNNCIGTLLKSKCVILVTHQVYHLKDANFIISMNQGKIEQTGRYEDLYPNENAVEDFGTLTIDELITEEQNEIKISLPPPLTTGEKRDSTTFDKELVSRAEVQNVGTVEWKTWFKYTKAGNSWANLAFILLFLFATQTLMSGSDMWLKKCTDKGDAIVLKHSKTSTYTENDYLYVYGGLVGGIFLMSLVVTHKTFRAALSSSSELHNRLVTSVFRAPMRFFQLNPSGRILNRYSNDIGNMDENLPQRVYALLASFSGVLGSFVIIIVTQPPLIIPTILLVASYFILIKIYVKPSSTTKRLEGISRSPIFAQLSTTLSGLSSVRTFGTQSHFTRQFHHFQNVHSANFYFYLSSTRWLLLSVELAADFYMAFVVIFFYFQTAASGTAFGLALSSAISLAILVCPVMYEVAEVINLMISVERVVEYTKLPSEAGPISMFKLRESWPERGGIQFNHLSLSYGDGVNTLSDITLCINPGEKIGIVGRTGAGKSSLISTLFRLVEPNCGNIQIDNLDIGQIGLRELRGKISVIPQTPLLFEGTLRQNLDPFQLNSDEEIWGALQKVEMKGQLDARGLDLVVNEGGSNFSQGERQLVCLARTILEKNKIIVLDEATANVDKRTDSIIQQSLRTEFVKCTVLTIAHRLETVIDADRILVLNSGMISEYDTPCQLLENGDSFFSRLVDNTGSVQSQRLRQLAYAKTKVIEAVVTNN